MEQIDLFSLRSKEDNFIELDANEKPPVTQCSKQTDKSVSDLAKLMHKYGHRIWRGDQHRKRSVAQVPRFDEATNLPLAEIKTTHIISFLDDLMERGASESTANRYTATLSSIFKFAIDVELIDSAPKVPFVKEPEGRIATYTHQQITDFISFFNGRGDTWMADVITVGYHTGMRKGEIEKIGTLYS